MSSSIRLNPTVVVVGAFLALLFILTLYMIRDGFHERSLKSVSGRLGQTETALRNVDGRLNAALDVEKNLKSELTTQEKQYREHKRALTEELERERAASRTLKQDMERLEGQHAESLAAEHVRAEQTLASAAAEHKRQLAEARQARTREAEGLEARHAESLAAERTHAEQVLAAAQEEYRQKLAQIEREAKTALDDARRSSAELEEQLAAAAQKRGGLVEEINDLNAVLQDTRVRHAEQIKALNDKVAYYRTAPEGSDAARSEQLARLELEVQRLQEALNEKRQAPQTEQADQVAALRGKLSATEQELQEARAMLEEAAQEGRRGENSEQLDQAQQEIAALTRRLEEEREAAEQSLDSLRQAHAEQEVRLKSQLAHSEQRLQQARQVYSEQERLRGQFAELNGQYTERGMRLTVSESELQFPGGQFNLPSTEIESLDRIVDFLQANKTLEVLVEGHTDSGGSERFNLILSRKRAEAVKQALVERGVEENRIDATGVGEASPIASNQTYNGRRQNRRVEIYIIEG